RSPEPWPIAGEMVDLQRPRCMVRKIDYRRGIDSGCDTQRFTDLLLGGARLQGLLDVSLQAALALRDERSGDGYQLLGLGVQYLVVRKVKLTVELAVDAAHLRVHHRIGLRPPILWCRIRFGDLVLA